MIIESSNDHGAAGSTWKSISLPGLTGYPSALAAPTQDRVFAGTAMGEMYRLDRSGNTWTLVNATPNDPVQRGPVCLQGTLGCSGNTRNLLDFNDLTVDKMGRVLAGLADGCVTDACRSGVDRNNDGRLDGNDNDGGAVATIIRQASGKGLFAQYDGQ